MASLERMGRERESALCHLLDRWHSDSIFDYVPPDLLFDGHIPFTIPNKRVNPIEKSC